MRYLPLSLTAFALRYSLEAAVQFLESDLRHSPPTACRYMVSGSLTPLNGVLFIFHSRYFCAIGHQGVFSLRRWTSRIQTGFHGTGLTWETYWRVDDIEYGTFTLYGRRCPRRSSSHDFCNSMTPSCRHPQAPTTPTVQRTRAYTRLVWAHSFSLAATGEIVFTFLSWSY